MGWKEIRKGSHKEDRLWNGQHRFEHWYVDNQAYFITARVRGGYAAFTTSDAKTIFWERFNLYVAKYSFVPWVTSLLSNHYHTLGHLRVGADLPLFIKGLHGSVAKLVNDTLPERISTFWCDGGHQNYFDGCIRDELQARRAYRYTLLQCRRHRICPNWKDYTDTRVGVELERAIKRALQLGAFMEEVPYKRYERHLQRGMRSRWSEG